jgi:hypothetical protein
MPESYGGQRMQCAQCRLEFVLHATPLPTTDGARLVLETAYVPAGSATGRLGAIYCVQCGTKYARTDDACPSCGQPIQEPIDTKSPNDVRLLRMHSQPINSFLLTVGAALLLAGLLSFIAAPFIAEGVFRGPRSVRTMIYMVGNGTGMCLELAAFCCFMRWLYQAWRLVLRGDEDYPPSLLVGLLFVPFFNFYWMFRAIPGLSLAVNEQLKAVAPTRNHANGWGAGIAACILALFPPAWPIAICMLLAWAFLTNHALNRLIRYHEQMRDKAERAAEQPLA